MAEEVFKKALIEALEAMRDVERRLDFSTLGECRWQLMKAADKAQTVLRVDEALIPNVVDHIGARADKRRTGDVPSGK